MPPNRLVLIRHARPIVDPAVPTDKWGLSEEGLAAAHRLGLFLQVDCGKTIWTSDEIKAQQTALQIAKVTGCEVATDPRLREVSRPFAGDPDQYREQVLTYLLCLDVEGWEPRAQVLKRFASCVDELMARHNEEHLLVVSHGLVTTLYIESTAATSPKSKGPIDPGEFWSDLQMPDAWRIDLQRNWLDRIGFTWDGLPISVDPPHGASVLVYRRVQDRLEFLLLHRSDQPPIGDWAWTPPAGARFPNEEVHLCALRELKEETGLDLTLVNSDLGTENWPQFLAEAAGDCAITLSDEHDAWEWVEAEEACSRCLPVVVSDSMRRALAYLRTGVGQG
ncbi:MAG TPA: histidine phosphatase family protein [Actinomycetota bacterium]|nr:histidine phosphatase family protein [Actinomycetota bacterium]